MVVKGSARSGPGELAAHLLRVDTNEAVRVLEFSGVAADNVTDALLELDGMGAGSRSKRTLYHASINTPVAEQLSPAQQVIARNRLAAELGLSDQPYVVVEHVKHGRQHTHVVWSRIDIATCRAIPDSHNYRRHELVCRELEQRFGHERVQGAHIRDKENQPRPERGPTWAEQRQAERSSIPPAEAKRIVTECWRETKTAAEFQQRLAAEGFTLAKGDRRDFVLIDHAGEVHGLTRRIEGAKARDVRERMSDFDMNQFPDVAEARRRQLLQQQENDAPTQVVSALERKRLEELQREAEARQGSRPSLGGSNQDAADAIWELNKTMRGQMENTIASGRLPDVVPPPGAADLPVDPSVQSQIQDSTIPTQRPSFSLFVRIFGWVVEHYQRLLDRNEELSRGADDPPERRTAPPTFDRKFAREEVGTQARASKTQEQGKDSPPPQQNAAQKTATGKNQDDTPAKTAADNLRSEVPRPSRGLGLEQDQWRKPRR